MRRGRAAQREYNELGQKARECGVLGKTTSQRDLATMTPLYTRALRGHGLCVGGRAGNDTYVSRRLI